MRAEGRCSPASPPLRHSAAVRFAAWAPDGKSVLTCGEDGLMLEARSGLSLDPRARAYFARRPSFEALVARLAARRAPAAPSQAAATRAFGELGLELLRTARSSYAVGSSGASGSNP